ncbi:uncharacterized protein LOC141609461 [Silene latifolia]|uniref:uncharacterized protein LOC141609461 n=1 Tax=Silene latifolia TaxID=37657 RepID=UPI003D783619
MVAPLDTTEVHVPPLRRRTPVVMHHPRLVLASAMREQTSQMCPDLSACCVPIASPEAPLDSEHCSPFVDSLTDSAVSQNSSPTDSKSHNLRFSNKRRPHTSLYLSSQDYENLLHGTNLGFYHPRSMSFMRVRPLTSKTIQTGTPHEVIHGTAEVPTSSPPPEIPFTPFDIEQPECVELVTEEVILQVDKKTRLNSFTPSPTMTSLVHYKFAAVRNYSLGKEKINVSCRTKVRKARVSSVSKESSLTSAKLSPSFCRYHNITTTTTSLKRKEAHLIEFATYYHPPFKKRRLFSSLLSPCYVSTVSWVSSGFGVAYTPSFVI